MLILTRSGGSILEENHTELSSVRVRSGHARKLRLLVYISKELGEGRCGATGIADIYYSGKEQRVLLSTMITKPDLGLVAPHYVGMITS